MKLTILYLLFSLLLSNSISAQNSDTIWTKIYGGTQVTPSPKSDAGQYMINYKGNGYAIIGNTYSFGAGEQDIWVLRTDSAGDTIWTRTYGGQYADEGYSISFTADGGLIISGSTFSYGDGNGDYWLIKTDSVGMIMWAKTFGGSEYDICYSTIQTFDGGYILLGYTKSFNTGDWDIWLIKTDSSGDSLWSKFYGGNGSDAAYSIQQTPDSGYIIAGVLNSSGLLLRIDSNGDTLWSKTYQDFKALYSVDQTIEGGYAATGYRNGKIGLLSADYTGGKKWSRSFNFPEQGEGRCVLETNDRGFIVIGDLASNGDVGLVKTNVNGDSLWSNVYGGSRGEEAGNIVQNADSSFTFVGSTNSFNSKGQDVWIVKIEQIKPTSRISTKHAFNISLITDNKSFYQNAYMCNLLGRKTAFSIYKNNCNILVNSYYVNYQNESGKANDILLLK